MKLKLIILLSMLTYSKLLPVNFETGFYASAGLQYTFLKDIELKKVK